MRTMYLIHEKTMLSEISQLRQASSVGFCSHVAPRMAKSRDKKQIREYQRLRKKQRWVQNVLGDMKRF